MVQKGYNKSIFTSNDSGKEYEKIKYKTLPNEKIKTKGYKYTSYDINKDTHLMYCYFVRATLRAYLNNKETRISVMDIYHFCRFFILIYTQRIV
eukprot:UN32768